MIVLRLPPIFAAIFLAAIVILVPLRTWAQCSGSCYPPQYDTDNQWPWPPTATVKVDFDPDGQLGSGDGDSKPKFTLTSSNEQAWFNGASKWQQQGQGNEVTMTEAQSSGPDVLIVTTAWPSATITWTDSLGETHTQTVSACDPAHPNADPCGANAQIGATSKTLYDYTTGPNGKRVISSYAAVAVTFINTNGTYVDANGQTQPIWNQIASNFSSALTAIGAHETGHTFGLGDQPAADCGDVMSQMAGTNNEGNCASGEVCACDDTELANVYSCSR